MDGIITSDKQGGNKMENSLYTVKEIAKMLKTNTDAIYKLMNSGELPYLVLGSRKVRWCTLEKFLEVREKQTMMKKYPERSRPDNDKREKMLDITTINGYSLYNENP